MSHRTGNLMANDVDGTPPPMTYVLVTPARDEARFIEGTIQSVVNQTLRPLRWVIVSDGSTDGTDEIILSYAARHAWIEFVALPDRHERHFAGKVQAFNAGHDRIRHLDFDILGSLDADISFDSEYFEFLMDKFWANPRLGVAGTPFRENDRQYDYRFVSIEHVSGACQMFRKECFDEIGGYTPIKDGGIDWVAVTTARMLAWQTRTFTEKAAIHARKIGTAKGSPLAARFRDGRQDYYLGGHPLWEVFRTAYQMSRPPYLLGGLWLFAGFVWAWASATERPIPPELVGFRRNEQMRRLKRFFALPRYRRSSVEPSSSLPQESNQRIEHMVMEGTEVVSIKGRSVALNSLQLGQTTVVERGKWLKQAVIKDEEWLVGEAIDDPESAIDRIRQSKLSADIFTFAQKLPRPTPRFDLPFEWDNVAAISTDNYQEWWERKVSSVFRKNVRRSIKRGLTIREIEFSDELIAAIVEINNETPVRQGRPFWHYRKSFDQVKRDYSTMLDRCEYIGAYSGGELVGFVKMIYMGEIAGILQLLCRDSHRDKRPANALVARAVEICHARGLKYLTYGQYVYGKREDSTLTEFKRRNGFEKFLLPRYYVPLTLTGKLALRSGLHKGLKHFVPGRLWSAAIGLRSRWYRIKLSGSADAA